MSNNQEKTSAIEELHNGRWLRCKGDSAQTLKAIKEKTAADMNFARGSSFIAEGDFNYLPITFISDNDGEFSSSHVVLAISRDVLVTIESAKGSRSIQRASNRLANDGRDNVDPFDIAVSVLQAISDATDDLIDTINRTMEDVVVQTGAVLSSLEDKQKDFGVTDVTNTQITLGDTEELLSMCLENQLILARATRRLQGMLGDNQAELNIAYETLLGDIEGVEEHVDFVHDRVRVLQQTNNLALNVKQNQIVKIFTAITAVFLPAMLVTTYYSMNFEFMPFLEEPLGEPIVMVLTFLFALIPMLYIRKRGWLR